MSWFAAPDYWFARLVFERGLAVIYVVAFTVAACQFRALLGADGLLPVPAYLRRVSFWQKPSLFHFRYRDRLFAATAWTGAALAAAMAGGLGDAAPLWGAMLAWLVLWALYLSIVNVGQLWYGFGWNRCCLRPGSSRSSWGTRAARRRPCCCGCCAGCCCGSSSVPAWSSCAATVAGGT
jgi:hypothetical protein